MGDRLHVDLSAFLFAGVGVIDELAGAAGRSPAVDERPALGECLQRFGGCSESGVSRDGAPSHAKFAEKYNLPFILLSDPDHAVTEAYGAWQEKKLYGKVSMGVVRSTFVIDERGNIASVMPKVKPDTNAAEVLAQL